EVLTEILWRQARASVFCTGASGAAAARPVYFAKGVPPMSHARILGLVGLAAVFALMRPAGAVQKQEMKPAYLRVYLPAGARLLLDEYVAKQTGPERSFETPPLPAGRTFTYVLKASWLQDGREVVRMAEAKVEA